ncbi:hypothetical protein HDV57DRAFT_148718 [Trichoderma longibrachiatum]
MTRAGLPVLAIMAKGMLPWHSFGFAGELMQPDGDKLAALLHVQQATGVPCSRHFLAFYLPVHLLRFRASLGWHPGFYILLGRALAC